jgi:hypothetical protein
MPFACCCDGQARVVAPAREAGMGGLADFGRSEGLTISEAALKLAGARRHSSASTIERVTSSVCTWTGPCRRREREGCDHGRGRSQTLLAKGRCREPLQIMQAIKLAASVPRVGRRACRRDPQSVGLESIWSCRMQSAANRAHLAWAVRFPYRVDHRRRGRCFDQNRLAVKADKPSDRGVQSKAVRPR